MIKMKKKNVFIVIFAILSALFMSVGRHFIALDDNNFYYVVLGYFKQVVAFSEEPVQSEDLYINVAYDKQLIEINDELGLPRGVTDITDREKLIRLLQLLKESNQYKFAFFDIRFEQGYVTENDSLLFALIKETPRLVLSIHKGMDLLDSSIMQKVAISEYSSDMDESIFTRYSLNSDVDIPSVPVYMYEAISGKKASSFGPFMLFDGAVGEAEPYIQFDVEFNSKYDADGKFLFYDLGVDILDQMSAEDFGVLSKDKYVVVGNITEDVHNTYGGLQPGCYIVMKAFKSIMNEKIMLHFWSGSIMALIYFLLVCAQFGTKPMWQYIPVIKKVKRKAVAIVLSMLSYSAVLMVCVTIMYWVSGEIYNIFVPTMYLIVVGTVVEHFDTIKGLPLVKKIFNRKG